jgi:hypothetical protein
MRPFLLKLGATALTLGGVTITPGVRQGDVQPVTSTYAS